MNRLSSAVLVAFYLLPPGLLLLFGVSSGSIDGVFSFISNSVRLGATAVLAVAMGPVIAKFIPMAAIEKWIPLAWQRAFAVPALAYVFYVGFFLLFSFMLAAEIYAGDQPAFRP